MKVLLTRIIFIKFMFDFMFSLLNIFYLIEIKKKILNCFILIISNYKIEKYVTSHQGGGGFKNVTTCDMDGFKKN